MNNQDSKTFDVKNERNLALLMDFYELTMSNCYFQTGMKDKKVVFDLFYRNNPDDGGFVIFAGLEQAIEYIKNLKFSESDIEYLRSLNKMSDEFLEYLSNFKFTGNIYSVKEGTPVYPKETLVRVEGKIIDVQLLETALLVMINHQSLIATKANRIVRAANGRSVMDFGARRAHNNDAAFYGARACYIGGVNATATVSSGKEFGIPVLGTIAHSFIQLYGTTKEDEYRAFLDYAKTYPDSCGLLLDTFDVLKSGLPNAIKLQKEYMDRIGKKIASVRIDSGDLAYLSKEIRKELDKNGMQDTKIVVSNSIDEYLINSLLIQGACIDSFGVGERMITSKSSPVFGGVYKLAAVEENGEWVSRIKKSENIEKITYPGRKKEYRFYSKETGYAEFDVIAFENENIPNTGIMKFIDPTFPQKHIEITLDNYDIEELLIPVFVDGICVYNCPSIQEIAERTKHLVNDTMWEEEKRFEYPNIHYVNLTEKLYNEQIRLLTHVLD